MVEAAGQVVEVFVSEKVNADTAFGVVYFGNLEKKSSKCKMF